MNLPRFGMGCSSLGNLYRRVSEVEALAAVFTAIEAGVRYFDTAPFYGFGLSERRLGLALADRQAADLVISTKVGRRLRPTPAPPPTQTIPVRYGFVDPAPFEPVFDYTFDGVMASYEESLGRLRQRRINVLLAHDLGVRTHGAASARMTGDFLAGGYEAMARLRTAGRVDAIGIGVNETQICEELLDQVELDVILLAGRYTLLEQGALPLLNRCAQLGVKVIVGGPFNSGLLVTPPDSTVVRYDYENAPREMVAKAHAMRMLCDQFHTPLAAAALHYPLAHPAVKCVLPGLATVVEVEQALTWRDLEIPGELWTQLRRAGLITAEAPIPGAKALVSTPQ
jgi:D-threo-aldose 1-dehydrogenase